MSNKSARDKLNQEGKIKERKAMKNEVYWKFLSDDLSNESVEVLRERLNAMKRLVAERQQQSNTTPGKIKLIKLFKVTEESFTNFA